jgi:hypothetical protein
MQINFIKKRSDQKIKKLKKMIKYIKCSHKIMREFIILSCPCSQMMTRRWLMRRKMWMMMIRLGSLIDRSSLLSYERRQLPSSRFTCRQLASPCPSILTSSSMNSQWLQSRRWEFCF